MNQKLIHEFGSKLYKTKTSYENNKKACDQLKREALVLEKELQDLSKQKEQQIKSEKDLEEQFNDIVKANEEENKQIQQDQEELNTLKNLKKKLQRERDLCKTELQKTVLGLDDVTKEHKELEALDSQITEKLNQIIVERQQLENEFLATMQAIEVYNQKIKEVQNDMNTMKGLVKNSCVTNTQEQQQDKTLQNISTTQKI